MDKYEFKKYDLSGFNIEDIKQHYRSLFGLCKKQVSECPNLAVETFNFILEEFERVSDSIAEGRDDFYNVWLLFDGEFSANTGTLVDYLYSAKLVWEQVESNFIDSNVRASFKLINYSIGIE